MRVGISAWLAAAAHEVPQETFLVGGIVAYGASFTFDVAFLLPFGAGNFIYIAAADLIPEIKYEENAGLNVVHFLSFLAGLALLLLLGLAFEH